MAACEERSNGAKTQSWSSAPLPFPLYFRFSFLLAFCFFCLRFCVKFIFYLRFLRLFVFSFSYFLFWLRQKLKLSCVFSFLYALSYFVCGFLFCLRLNLLSHRKILVPRQTQHLPVNIFLYISTLKFLIVYTYLYFCII